MPFSQPDTVSLTWNGPHEILRIEGWGEDALRIRTAPGRSLPEPLGPDGALIARAGSPVSIEIGADRAIVRNGAIAAEIDLDGALRFLAADDGRVLLAEEPRHFVGPLARHYEPRADGRHRIEASFAADDEERLYGLGQQQHGRLDLKGCVIDLVQRNTHVVVPFLLSSRGYGFLWHDPSVGRVELGRNGTRWVAEASAGMDYWIVAGSTPATILERYTGATGRVPMMPDRAVGFWQSKLRYRSQAEVLAVAREHVGRGLPLGVIVVDAGHWPVMGDWRFDPERWPDPGAMARELDALGVDVMVSVWPTVNDLSENLAELQARGLLARTTRGDPHPTWLFDNRPDGPVRLHLYDATDPAARAFLGDRLRDGYLRRGIRRFWLDANEPEIKPLEPDRVEYHLGPGLALHNLYPHLHARAVHDALVEAGVTDVLTLGRSAWAGSQRYGAAVWSGDVDSSWEALRAQVPAGLNAGLSGIAWWGSDIGGFKGGDAADPGFRELLIRWFQFGTLCPLFRLHGLRRSEDEFVFDDLADLAETPPASDPARSGESPEARRRPFNLVDFTGGPNEVWSFGDEAYQILGGFLQLRERLRPYLLAQMRAAHECGLPPMRALFLEFPSDPATHDIRDAYMLGPDLLVAPILQPGATEREVYLPAGAEWREAWTGAELPGGGTSIVTAPLERIPLFLRDDARLPIVAANGQHRSRA